MLHYFSEVWAILSLALQSGNIFHVMLFSNSPRTPSLAHIWPEWNDSTYHCFVLTIVSSFVFSGSWRRFLICLPQLQPKRKFGVRHWMTSTRLPQRAFSRQMLRFSSLTTPKNVIRSFICFTEKWDFFVDILCKFFYLYPREYRSVYLCWYWLYK